MNTKQVLMCQPDYYGIEYEINPWMKVSNQPNKTLALEQWQNLKIELERAGLLVSLMRPVPGLPDMVFTANGGLRYHGGVILTNFKYRERQKEMIHFVKFFLSQQYTCGWLPPGVFFEGEGDALFCGETLACGYGTRSDKRGVTIAAKIIGKEPILLKLIDPYFYHLDTCFCYPKKDLVLCYLPAFDATAQKEIEKIGEVISVSDADAKNFVCNAVPVGDKLITSPMSDGLRLELQRRGIEPTETPMSEFIKAGGAAKCLTLFLEHG